MEPRDLYYDREARPISQREWARLEEAPGYKVVAQHQVGNAWVSTVWLGINHRFSAGPPVIYETLVFGGRMDGDMLRYCTEAQAVEGHGVMVARVRAIQGEPVEVIPTSYDERTDP